MPKRDSFYRNPCSWMNFIIVKLNIIFKILIIHQLQAIKKIKGEIFFLWISKIPIVFWDLTLKSNTIHSLNVFCCVYLYTVTFFHKINQTFFMKSQLGRLCLYWCNCGLFEEEKTAERYTKNPLLVYAYMFTIMSKTCKY